MSRKKYQITFLLVLSLLVILFFLNKKDNFSVLSSDDKASQIVTGVLQDKNQTFIVSTSGTEYSTNEDLNLFIKTHGGSLKKIKLIEKNVRLVLSNGQCLDPQGLTIYLAWAEKTDHDNEVITAIGSYNLKSKKFNIIKKIQIKDSAIYPSSLACHADKISIATYITSNTGSIAYLWKLNLNNQEISQIYETAIAELGSFSIVSQAMQDRENKTWVVGYHQIDNTKKMSGFVLKEENSNNKTSLEKFKNFDDQQLIHSIFQDNQGQIFILGTKKLPDSALELTVQKISNNEKKTIYQKVFLGLGLLSASMIEHDKHMHLTFSVYENGGYTWYSKRLESEHPEQVIDYGKSKSCHGGFTAIEDNSVVNYGSCIIDSGNWRIISYTLDY